MVFFHFTATDEGIHSFCIIITTYVINTLEHHTETNAFVIASQGKCIRIFRYIAITNECFVSFVNKTIIIHIAIFQIAYLYITKG